VALEPWEPEGLEVLEGDPQTRGHIFFESGPEGSGFEPGGTVVGVYEQQPCKTRYRLVQTETVHLLDGDIQIELDNGGERRPPPGRDHGPRKGERLDLGVSVGLFACCSCSVREQHLGAVGVERHVVGDRGDRGKRLLVEPGDVFERVLVGDVDAEVAGVAFVGAAGRGASAARSKDSHRRSM